MCCLRTQYVFQRHAPVFVSFLRMIENAVTLMKFSERFAIQSIFLLYLRNSD